MAKPLRKQHCAFSHHAKGSDEPGVVRIFERRWVAVLVAIVGETPELAVYSFAFLGIPSFVLSVVKLFGRESKPGDVLWYLRPQMKWFYRVASTAVVAYTFIDTGVLAWFIGS